MKSFFKKYDIYFYLIIVVLLSLVYGYFKEGSYNLINNYNKMGFKALDLLLPPLMPTIFFGFFLLFVGESLKKICHFYIFFWVVFSLFSVLGLNKSNNSHEDYNGTPDYEIQYRL